MNYRLTEKELSTIITNAINNYLKDNSSYNSNPCGRINGDIPDLRNKSANYGNTDFVRSNIEKIEEGIFSTYDIDAAKRFVCSQCNLSYQQFQVDNRVEDGVITPVVTIILPPTITNDFVEFVVQKMFACGYSRSTKLIYNQQYNIYSVLFEPMKGEDITEYVRNNMRFLYHATPTVYVKKIQQIGLCPKSKNGLFLYPSRVYCMKGDTLTKGQKTVHKNMQRVRAASVDINNKKNKDDNTYYLLTIDVSKIPDTVRFMTDPMGIPNKAIFTYDNIPPSAITSYKRYYLSFNDIKNRIRKIVQKVLKESVSDSN